VCPLPFSRKESCSTSPTWKSSPTSGSQPSPLTPNPSEPSSHLVRAFPLPLPTFGRDTAYPSRFRVGRCRATPPSLLALQAFPKGSIEPRAAKVHALLRPRQRHDRHLFVHSLLPFTDWLARAADSFVVPLVNRDGCSRAGMFFWNSEQMKYANIFVTINSLAQFYYCYMEIAPSTPENRVTRLVAQTFAGVGLLVCLSPFLSQSPLQTIPNLYLHLRVRVNARISSTTPPSLFSERSLPTPLLSSPPPLGSPSPPLRPPRSSERATCVLTFFF
jgi:hypothetical protein